MSIFKQVLFGATFREQTRLRSRVNIWCYLAYRLLSPNLLPFLLANTDLLSNLRIFFRFCNLFSQESKVHFILGLEKHSLGGVNPDGFLNREFDLLFILDRRIKLQDCVGHRAFCWWNIISNFWLMMIRFNLKPHFGISSLLFFKIYRCWVWDESNIFSFEISFIICHRANRRRNSHFTLILEGKRVWELCDRKEIIWLSHVLILFLFANHLIYFNKI